MLLTNLSNYQIGGINLEAIKDEIDFNLMDEGAQAIQFRKKTTHLLIAGETHEKSHKFHRSVEKNSTRNLNDNRLAT